MDSLGIKRQLGLTLLSPPATADNYTSAKTSSSIVFLVGATSETGDGVLAGTVGLDHSIEEGHAASAPADYCGSVLRQRLGSLKKVRSILSANGYADSISGFSDPPKVNTGAAAIGVSGLTRNAFAELQMTVEI